MRNLSLFFAAFVALLFFASCSDKEGETVNVYGKDNFCVTTHAEMVAPAELDIKEDNVERFHFIIAFTEWGRLQMCTRTYVSIEMYSDNQLMFIEDASDDVGGLWLSEFVFLKNNEWQDRLYYFWYQMVVASASGEGEFEFAVKFYYPERNQTCITPRYRMKLWYDENGNFQAKTTLIE